MKAGANLQSTLRRRAISPIAAHDRLPQQARRWVAEAALPWSAASVARLWRAALREGGGPDRAIARLQAAEARALARDAPRIWGQDYPV